jgi:hypothetical protein
MAWKEIVVYDCNFCERVCGGEEREIHGWGLKLMPITACIIKHRRMAWDEMEWSALMALLWGEVCVCAINARWNGFLEWNDGVMVMECDFSNCCCRI